MLNIDFKKYLLECSDGSDRKEAKQREFLTSS